MPCYHPITAYQAAIGVKPRFSPSTRAARKLALPCGQCVGCRLERSRQWAVRCMHEARMHGECNEYVTLTYDEEHLPKDGSLRHRDFVLFMKKLRRHVDRADLKSKEEPTNGNPPFTWDTTERRIDKDEPRKIKFYMAGEYGERKGRPHYHAILFGVRFSDRKLKKVKNGNKLYESELATKIWGMGEVILGEVTFESAAYVARYVMKKVTGRAADAHYRERGHRNPDTGEITPLEPEYNVMSRGEGLGKAWLARYKTDAYPEGKVVVRGQLANTPRFYDNVFKETDPELYQAMKDQRAKEADKHFDDNSKARLAAKETVAKAKIEKLKRSSQ